MAKTLALLLVLILIASTVAAWVAYNQLNGFQKKIDGEVNITITKFSSGGWGNPVGVTMAVGFNVTILNNGVDDVDGVILEIKRSSFDSDPFNITRPLGILHAGETEVQESLIINMDTYFAEFYNSSFLCTLKIGVSVLDESILEITAKQF